MNFCKIAIILYHFFNNLHNKRKTFSLPKSVHKIECCKFFQILLNKGNAIRDFNTTNVFLSGKDSLYHSCQDLTGIL